MSAVEHKESGHFVDSEKKLRRRMEQVGDGEGDGFGYDVFPFEGEEFSYALGAQVRHAALHTTQLSPHITQLMTRHSVEPTLS